MTAPETPCLSIDDIFFLRPGVNRIKNTMHEGWREKIFIYAKRLSVLAVHLSGRIAGRGYWQ
ncbi:MAG TPA: hypothetical protein VFK11_03960 [Candidatus Saccharimonadales bacterium]|nr:hypothetical protein [Candidatus Saccharimonadales bacterium]